MNAVPLKVITLLALAGCSYYFGYSVAETEGELAMTQLEKSLSQKSLDMQEEVRREYEKKQKELVANFDAERDRDAYRLRQLQRKLRAQGDLEAVTGERDRCLALATRGEQLLYRADGFIDALNK